MDSLTRHILQQTAAYFAAQRRPAYVVGGSLRNIMLGEACSDWDIVVVGDAHKLARRLADTLGGHYARMHDKASRVIVKTEAANSAVGKDITDLKDITLDIASMHGQSIEDDLRARDFTINALAAPLETINSLHVQLIDPLHGVEDLRARRLRAIDDAVFLHDPLRMLRAVRLLARYRLSLDDETRNIIKRDAALLPTVAAERIHEELYAILEADDATTHLRLLDELGILTALIPEFIPARGMRQPPPHYWDVLEHSLETVSALELIARACTLVSSSVAPDVFAHLTPTEKSATSLKEIQAVMQEAQAQGIFASAELIAPRMKMAALLHDIGKPDTFVSGEDGSIRFYNHPQIGALLALQITRRLNSSTKDRRLAQLVAAHHMRPGQLGQDGTVTPRAIRRFFVDMGPPGIAVALFSLADHLATLGPQPLTGAWERHISVVALLLTRYIRERESILPPRLLSPEELMRRLKLEPGPLVGQLLDAIAEAQSDGAIHSREEALWFAEERLPDLP